MTAIILKLQRLLLVKYEGVDFHSVSQIAHAFSQNLNRSQRFLLFLFLDIINNSNDRYGSVLASIKSANNSSE
jgi:hypothetical protein